MHSALFSHEFARRSAPLVRLVRRSLIRTSPLSVLLRLPALGWALLGVVLFCLASRGATGAWAAEPLRAGAAAVDISPPRFPVIVSGGFLHAVGERLHDRLHARCLVLESGQTRIALLIVDSLMIERDVLDPVKHAASEATGIPADHILISATHTHSAPAVMGALGTPADEPYRRWLAPLLVRVIVEAAGNLQPARIGWTVAAAPQYTHNRRWIFRPDRLGTDPFGQRNVRAMMHPGHESPNHVGPSGPVDPDLYLLSVQSRSGRPIALLTNYSQHYFGAPAVSADYFGRFAAGMEEKVAQHHSAAADAPPFVAMMSAGTSGDLMWMDYSRPRERWTVDEYAERVAEVAWEAYQTIEYAEHVPLVMLEETLAFRRRTPDAERLAWARPIVEQMAGREPRSITEVYAREAVLLDAEPQVEIKLQALRIGELAIVAMPHEVFALTGLKIKEQSPFAHTFVIELANGAQGYIPPPEQHALGGYTTWPARTAGLEVDAEPKQVAALLAMLARLAGRPLRKPADPQAAYSRAVAESKPVAWWRLDDMSGTVARDAAGGERHAEYESGVAFYLDGPGGSGLDGGRRGNRAVHIAGGRLRAQVPVPVDRYSVELWFYNALPTDAREVTGWLFARGDDPVTGEQLGVAGQGDAAGRIAFRARRDAAARVGKRSTVLRGWHHLVYVREGRQIRVHLDGRPEPDLATEAGPAEPTDRFWFGGRGDGRDGWEGKLDEIAVYDRPLEADEIAAHFRASGRDGTSGRDGASGRDGGTPDP